METKNVSLGVGHLEARITKYPDGNWAGYIRRERGRIESVGETERQCLEGLVDSVIMLLEYKWGKR